MNRYDFYVYALYAKKISEISIENSEIIWKK